MSRADAFWDSSALIPLCILQTQTNSARALFTRFRIVTWWATEVEILSGLTRLKRMGSITQDQFAAAKQNAQSLVRGWFSVQKSTNLASNACAFLELYPLRAADALQLAASLEACRNQPSGYVFVTGDERQADAARQIGFTVEFV